MREPLPVDTLETVPARDDLYADAVRRADLVALRHAIDALPPQQRDALLLREFGGLSYDELAAALAVSGPAVESLLFRARTRLRAQLRAAYASLGGAPWLETLARGFVGGGAPVAAKVAALGVGAVAVTGGAVMGPQLLDRPHHRPAVVPKRAPQAARVSSAPVSSGPVSSGPLVSGPVRPTAIDLRRPAAGVLALPRRDGSSAREDGHGSSGGADVAEQGGSAGSRSGGREQETATAPAGSSGPRSNGVGSGGAETGADSSSGDSGVSGVSGGSSSGSDSGSSSGPGESTDGGAAATTTVTSPDGGGDGPGGGG